ncbi:glycosyltransferase family 4 protein [bacterium]|nr:glycosyltransferase family 4 protein [bacterium]
MKKRILFDALILSSKNTGVARGILEILEDIKGKENVFILANKFFPLERKDYKLIFIPHSHIPFIRIPFQLFIIPFFMIINNFKTYFSPTHILPILKYGKYIIVMHDLMLYKVRRKYPFLKSILYHFYYHIIFQNSDEFITPSEHTKKDLLNFTKKPIKVIPWKIGKISQCKSERRHFKENFEYILTVGSLEKGKNLDYLINAYSVMKNDLKNRYKLIITGKNINSGKSIMKFIKKYHLENNVLFTGFVSDERLISLYRSAALFVFPSKYEGFGFPVLEAIYFGVPTICSDSSALKEILYDPIFRFPLNNVRYLAELMEKMIVDSNYINKWNMFRKTYTFNDLLGYEEIFND